MVAPHAIPKAIGPPSQWLFLWTIWKGKRTSLGLFTSPNKAYNAHFFKMDGY